MITILTTTASYANTMVTVMIMRQEGRIRRNSARDNITRIRTQH